MQEVWENAGTVKGDALVVLLALAHFCNDDYECCESASTLASRARVTEESIRKVTKRLEEQGFIKTLIRGQGQGNYSRYRVMPNGKNLSSHESKPQHKSGFEEQEPQLETGFNDQKPQLKTPFEGQGLLNGIIGDARAGAVGGEDLNKFKSSPGGGETRRQGNSPPPPSNKSQLKSELPPEIHTDDLDWLALQEVTSRIWGVGTRNLSDELVDVIKILRSQQNPTADADNIRRFGQRWKELGRSTPYPGQVARNWSTILSPPKQSTPIENSRRGYRQHDLQTPAQRREDAWAEWIQDCME
jgi:DNA-binding PadR family transcriptional regulator